MKTMLKAGSLGLLLLMLTLNGAASNSAKRSEHPDHTQSLIKHARSSDRRMPVSHEEQTLTELWAEWLVSASEKNIPPQHIIYFNDETKALNINIKTAKNCSALIQTISDEIPTLSELPIYKGNIPHQALKIILNVMKARAAHSNPKTLANYINVLLTIQELKAQEIPDLIQCADYLQLDHAIITALARVLAYTNEDLFEHNAYYENLNDHLTTGIGYDNQKIIEDTLVSRGHKKYLKRYAKSVTALPSIDTQQESSFDEQVRNIHERTQALKELATSAYNTLPVSLKTYFKGVSIKDLFIQDLLPSIEYSDPEHEDPGSLDLSNQYINSPEGLESIPGINWVGSIDLSNNLVATIKPYAFAAVEYLWGLSLDNNQLTTLEENAFAGTNSEEFRCLGLGNNTLTHIHPGAFNNLTHLTDLDLHNNNLPHLIPTTLALLNKLVELRIDGNQLDTQEKARIEAEVQTAFLGKEPHRAQIIFEKLIN